MWKRPGGYFFLSVPNIDRLSNRLSRLLGRSIPWDPTHYREYTLGQIKQLVTEAGFEIVDAQGVYLLLPPEPLSRKIIAVDSSIRNAVKFFPSLGRNIFLICHKPTEQATMQEIL